MTIRDKHREIVSNLSNFEAMELLAFALGKTRAQVLRDFNEPLPSSRIDELTARRLSGEPLAYILGEWDFYGLRLMVTPDVLIPRSDSEVHIDIALKLLNSVSHRTVEIVDLCCGSGCLGLAILSNYPNAHLTAIDISDAALEITRLNAEKLGVSDKITVLKADVLQQPNFPLPTADYILMISNPPYIRLDEMQELERSVKDFEPHIALDGGDDGLDFYRAIGKYWAKYADALILECSKSQVTDIERIFADCTIPVTITGF